MDQFWEENCCLYQRKRTKERQLLLFFPINEQGRGGNGKREKVVAGGVWSRNKEKLDARRTR